MKTVEINGKSYRVWFKHINLINKNLSHDEIEKAKKDIRLFFHTALVNGQTKVQMKEGQILDQVPSFNGCTVCSIEESKDAPPFAMGYAFCSSKDQFNKSIGRKVSFNRALKQAYE